MDNIITILEISLAQLCLDAISLCIHILFIIIIIIILIIFKLHFATLYRFKGENDNVLLLIPKLSCYTIIRWYEFTIAWLTEIQYFQYFLFVLLRLRLRGLIGPLPI